MHADKPITTYRKDYTPPSFFVDTVEMGLDLDPKLTRVATRTRFLRNPNSDGRDLILLGEGLKLGQIRLNGKKLPRTAFQIDTETLTIFNPPDDVTLEIETHICPQKNTSLTGLYVSNHNFFTQCEAQGFRRITYFLDRPDVMAKFTVMLRADKKKYPVLLSNGNLVESGKLSHGRHYAKWEDPFKKPSYLFAIVAGKLVCQEEKIKLQSGRKALLQVWVEKGNLDKTQHAMESLKHSIRWDEKRFGLELDLERFMIVAVSDFNMGAMENKGLNIFNTKYVLANPRVATDNDYAGIESVVGHEYFHNWTGNRVTCRDWFQLSLKEGLTVFRDQEFSADMKGSMTGRAVNRIGDVRMLRQMQFPEDAGPMAHPVRPESYVEINNFYSVTVYEKGAELVRMYQTLLGEAGFRRGMDLYFQRHDGQAVTCDDFRAAMADANGRDFTQFERWYAQAGTPRVKVTSHYNALKKTYELTFHQSCPATPGQPHKKPFHIPVAVGLIDASGKDMPLHCVQQPTAKPCNTLVLELTQARQSFQFTEVHEEPTPSLLRNFSAPVECVFDYSDKQLTHLLIHDSDAFNRWEASQRMAMRHVLKVINAIQTDKRFSQDAQFLETFKKTITNTQLDAAFRVELLTYPSMSVIAEHMDAIDPQAIKAAHDYVHQAIAFNLGPVLLNAYADNDTPGQYSPDALSSGRRALKNLALNFLQYWPIPYTFDLAYKQCKSATNMTDRLGALSGIINATLADKTSKKLKAKALKQFYSEFKHDPLVIDKWFALQASSHLTDVDGIKKLLKHPAFSLKNPNRARSVIFSFCNNNFSQFHAPDGSGYSFWADKVMQLDAINPQVAARLARSLDRWRNYIPPLRTKMKEALQRVAASKTLSRDVSEIITKTLKEPT